jgi:hypothetical protein
MKFGEEHIMTCLVLEDQSLGLDGLDLRLDSDLPVLTWDLSAVTCKTMTWSHLWL